MSDMASRLLAGSHGYTSVETRWDDAIAVDVQDSILEESDFKSIRRTIRLSLASLKREARQLREAAAEAAKEK